MSSLDLHKLNGFDWDAGNRAKNAAKHSVETREVEEVFLNEPVVAELERTGEPRWAAYGQTDDGRRLTVVFTVRGNLLRPISARPMSRKERSAYANEPNDSASADESGGAGAEQPEAGPEDDVPEPEAEPGADRPADSDAGAG